MMYGIVAQVEANDSTDEAAPFAAVDFPVPIVDGHTAKRVGDMRRGSDQFAGDGRRILAA